MQLRTDLPHEALSDSKLFSPIKVGSTTLSHRVVMAPLTRLRHPDNILGPDTAKYYAQRAQRPGTLLIAEGAYVSPAAGGFDAAPGIWSSEQIEAWKKVTDAVHSKDSKMFIQVYAMGRQADPAVLAAQGLPFASASAIYKDAESEKSALEAKNPIKALTKDEIKRFVKDHVTASENALKAGADGVEFHCANGYLLNQFLDPLSNQRTDEYGGSIENRARFPLEIVDALIEAIGADKFGVRLSPFGLYGTMSGVADPGYLAQYAYFVGELEKRAQKGHRLAYIHTIEPRVARIHSVGDDAPGTEGSSDFLYDIWKGVIIRAGDYGRHPELAREHAERGNTLIAYGRFFISTPDLPDRLYNGQPLNAYDRTTFYMGDSKGYTDYPRYDEL